MELTKEHRKQLLQKMQQLPTPEDRIRHIAKLRETPGKAWEVSILSGIHGQLCETERRQELVNTPTASPQPRYAIIIKMPDGWSVGRVAIVTSVVVASGTVGYYLIPFIGVVLLSIGQVIGYAIAGAFGFFFCVMGFQMLRNPSKSESESERGGARYYNYQGGNHHHHHYENAK